MSEEGNSEVKRPEIEQVPTEFLWKSLVGIEDFIFEIKKHGSTEEEEAQLSKLSLRTLNLGIFDAILSHLPGKEHESFLDEANKLDKNLRDGIKTDTLLDYLIEKGLEDLIKETADKTKKEILDELTKE